MLAAIHKDYWLLVLQEEAGGGSMSDEAGVINIEDHRPHIHGHAMCLGCKREWMAVAPESTTKIECPNCHSMDGRFLGASRNCSRCNYEKLVLRERAAMEQLDCRRWQECGRELSQEVDRLRARAFYLAAENDKDKQRIAELEREREALIEVGRAAAGIATNISGDPKRWELAVDVLKGEPGALARWMSREAK